MNLRKKGSKYEIIAVEYFKRLNYGLVVLNWCCRWGEIDIILSYKDEIVFVEVKFRNHDNFDINEVFTLKKKNSLKRSIFIYLKENNLFENRWRLDLFYITCSGSNKSRFIFRHFKNILL
ncbi:MAG: hypothetical protein ACD_24C00100G0005 [uncultured bacterium]|uniref:Uncharacterized protein n=1 Tax=candidate division WWE3 bacterium RBG_16_37_10 TaxID=1802610 RepID=A0A1F4UT75_UNCKA|nr:MAG: hypothetical protein ACD_24C00100G0005 [uncultured bacterium]OGC48148.1 MAG: hypothetical protein A2W32_01590 [candidate division WWE3 bacterium RBG_16_37_10]